MKCKQVPDKFGIEKSILSNYLEAAGINHNGLLKPHKDPPDVITRIDHDVVGVEVTRLISHVNDKMLAENWNIIFEKVKKRLLEKGIVNLRIRIEQDKNKKINRDKCIDIIVNKCLENFDKITNHRTLIATNPQTGIKQIFAYKKVGSKENVITFDSRRRTFGSLLSEKLKEIIENKIVKVNKSKLENDPEKENLDFYWLLISIEGAFYADYAGVESKHITIDQDNCFDRVIVFHEDEKWIKEIKIKLL